ncbi:hypothetical protein HOC13_01210 [Candidatus Woesearchaeota archaeon]|nr:hypothetical protein [Candidatus Woesearchaeota archaeon]
MRERSPFNRCVECEETITQPICGECLAVRMKNMVGEYDTKLAKDIAGLNVEGETKCIFCGEGMGLCAHCFSKDIYEYLAEKNIKIAKEFLSRFDFDLRRVFI